MSWLQTKGSSDHGKNGKQETLDGPRWLFGYYHIRVFANQKHRLEEAGYTRELTDSVDGGKPRGQGFPPLTWGCYFASELGEIRFCIRHMWCCWRDDDFLTRLD